MSNIKEEIQLKNLLYKFHYETRPSIKNTIYALLIIMVLYSCAALLPNFVENEYLLLLSRYVIGMFWTPFNALIHFNDSYILAMAVQVLSILFLSYMMGLKNTPSTLKLKALLLLLLLFGYLNL